MFSQEARCLLKKNQLAEVICQFRFPEILIIGTNPPAQFQELVRATFPQYSLRKEIAKNDPNAQPIHNHQFATADGQWRVNTTSGFISLTCSRYTQWEEFAGYFDKILAAFIKTYSPAYFTRVGLRYLNFISRDNLGLTDVPYAQLIEPCYLGLLAEEDVWDNTVNRCTVDAEMKLRGGCVLKVHAGPGIIKRNGVAEKEPRFIFDQDLFMSGNIPVQTCAGALNTLHSQAYSVFRGAIQDTLFQAMEPEEI